MAANGRIIAQWRDHPQPQAQPECSSRLRRLGSGSTITGTALTNANACQPGPAQQRERQMGQETSAGIAAEAIAHLPGFPGTGA
jgi:hypothetical protein